MLGHAALGVLPLFLVHVGPGETGSRCEASFHRAGPGHRGHSTSVIFRVTVPAAWRNRTW